MSLVMSQNDVIAAVFFFRSLDDLIDINKDSDHMTSMDDIMTAFTTQVVNPVHSQFIDPSHLFH